MKLTKRGELVFAITSLFTLLAIVSAIIFGARFVLTHHAVIDQATCQMTDEGMACDYHYERN